MVKGLRRQKKMQAEIEMIRKLFGRRAMRR